MIQVAVMTMMMAALAVDRQVHRSQVHRHPPPPRVGHHQEDPVVEVVVDLCCHRPLHLLRRLFLFRVWDPQD